MEEDHKNPGVTDLQSSENLRIMISPLGWGLGHATRLVPLIHYLQQKNCQIWITGSGPTLALLRTACPFASFLELPMAPIRYPGGGPSLALHLLSQLPVWLRMVREERTWLRTQVLRYKWDGIISDNRYGFSHPDAYSVFLGHQLQIKSGFGPLADRLATSLQRRYLVPFHEIWVPDAEGVPNLSGLLGHGYRPPGRLSYLGPLSHLRPAASATCIRKWLILLSGPEPQRSALEKLVLTALRPNDGPVLLVRGLPGASDRALQVPEGVQVADFMAGDELAREIGRSEWVLARSGYSSVMDLVRLKARALLLPTPGQGEQEYLAKHLRDNGIFPFLCQSDFSFEKAIGLLSDFPWTDHPFDFSGYRAPLDNWLETLRRRRQERG